MLKWLDWSGRIIIVAFAIILIYRFWVWWMPKEPETYLRTDLINAQETDQFYTGFATVAVLQFKTSDGLQPFSFISANKKNAEHVTGYCYRLYEISIGYPSLRAAVDSSETSSKQKLTIESPQVMSGNVIEARHGGEATQYECDQFNRISARKNNSLRLASLQTVLDENGQWPVHVKHGQEVLVAFSKKLMEKRKADVAKRLAALQESETTLNQVESVPMLQDWVLKTEERLAQPADSEDLSRGAPGGQVTTGITDLDELIASTNSKLAGDERADTNIDLVVEEFSRIFRRENKQVRSELTRTSGYLGSLKLTFSTIGIFSQQSGRWFWKSNQFYVRQDIADATYGSDFALDLSTTTGGIFSPTRIRIVIPEPHLLALDRYTPVLVAKPTDFELQKEKTKGSSIEASLLADLQAQLKRIEPQAIRFARSMLTAQIYRLVNADAEEIEIKFSRTESDTSANLIDLLRQAQQPAKK